MYSTTTRSPVLCHHYCVAHLLIADLFQALLDFEQATLFMVHTTCSSSLFSHFFAGDARKQREAFLFLQTRGCLLVNSSWPCCNFILTASHCTKRSLSHSAISSLERCRTPCLNVRRFRIRGQRCWAFPYYEMPVTITI